MTTTLKSIFLAMIVIVLVGCGRSSSTNVTVTQEANPAISPNDFALDTVVGLLKQGASDGPTLEAKINDPSTGINNIDIDKDGKIDYVQVVESQIPSGKKLELIVHASSNSIPDVTIAGIKFAQNGDGVDVQAGYAPTIDPAGQYYYQDRLLTNMLIAQWLFMPSRPLYYVHSVPSTYAYRTRVPASQFTQTRSTFTQTTRVAPVAATPRPASFNAARVTAPPRGPATTLGGASQGVSSFGVDSRSKAAGTGFGASPSTRTASPSPVSRPASSPVSRPSSPSVSRRTR